MAPLFVFFDQTKEKIDGYQKYLSSYPNMIFIHGTLDDILNTYYNKSTPFVLVSPANSYGNMRGGIDLCIIRKFPECEKKVLDEVKKSPYIDSTSRNIIPVGKCRCVELDNKQNVLIIAPTMETPKNIQGTENVYAAFKAIYKVTKQLSKNTIVACPCLGTGIGGMSGEDSALQILKYLQYVNK